MKPRLYEFEKNKNAQTFIEKLERNHDKQKKKYGMINFNFENRSLHNRKYQPSKLSKQGDPIEREDFIYNR